MQNPFTRTFSKLPKATYISTEGAGEIIDNFNYEDPSESVYKITGVRGSGKTVLLAKVEEEYNSEERRNQGWLVYRLSPNRDMLLQLASGLHREKFVKKGREVDGFSVGASIFGSGGSIGLSKSREENYFDIGFELEQMMEAAMKSKKKILIGIDEVSKTKEMIVFASEFVKWLRAGYPVFLVCTGLYDNVRELSNVKNLTFFRRATTVQTEPLSFVKMSEVYKRLLGVDVSISKQLADITNGYAYAFQILGNLYFKKPKNVSLNSLIDNLKDELYAFSYEKIWEELSPAERSFLSHMTEKKEYSRGELLSALGDKAKGYSVYRDRLLKKGLLYSKRPCIGLSLPYFADYIKEYGIAL